MSCWALKPAEPHGNSSMQKQRLWKRFQKMDVLPTKDQRAVIRLINSLAGSSHGGGQLVGSFMCFWTHEKKTFFS